MDYDIISVLTNLTQGEVLALCLIAFAATLILPRLIRERKLARKKSRAGRKDAR